MRRIRWTCSRDWAQGRQHHAHPCSRHAVGTKNLMQKLQTCSSVFFCEWYLLLHRILGSSSSRSRIVDGLRARQEEELPRCSFIPEICGTHGLQKGQACAAWRAYSVQVASVSASRRASRARLIPGRLTRARALRGSCVGRAQGPRPRCAAEPPWRVVEKK